MITYKIIRYELYQLEAIDSEIISIERAKPVKAYTGKDVWEVEKDGVVYDVDGKITVSSGDFIYKTGWNEQSGMNRLAVIKSDSAEAELIRVAVEKEAAESSKIDKLPSNNPTSL